VTQSNLEKYKADLQSLADRGLQLQLSVGDAERGQDFERIYKPTLGTGTMRS